MRREPANLPKTRGCSKLKSIRSSHDDMAASKKKKTPPKQEGGGGDTNFRETLYKEERRTHRTTSRGGGKHSQSSEKGGFRGSHFQVDGNTNTSDENRQLDGSLKPRTKGLSMLKPSEQPDPVRQVAEVSKEGAHPHVHGESG